MRISSSFWQYWKIRTLENWPNVLSELINLLDKFFITIFILGSPLSIIVFHGTYILVIIRTSPSWQEKVLC